MAKPAAAKRPAGGAGVQRVLVKQMRSLQRMVLNTWVALGLVALALFILYSYFTSTTASY